MPDEELKKRLDAVHARARDALFITYLGCYHREQPQTAQETTAVAGCLVAALVSVAALVAQDLGVDEEAFVKIAKESHVAAVAGAPRWQ